jgi:hypothetical protein
MSNRNIRSFRSTAIVLATALLAPLVAGVRPSPAAPPDNPAAKESAVTIQQLFQRGRQLVEDNCADCASTRRSRKEVLEAVDLLKKALRRGYKDEAGVHRLLMIAYSNLSTVFTREGSTVGRVAFSPIFPCSAAQ